MLQELATQPGWYVLITPGAVVGVGLGLARVLWKMHVDANTDRATWLQAQGTTNSKLGQLDQALRGYDGEGGMLYDLRRIREARHAEATVIMSLQSQVSELRAAVGDLARRVDNIPTRGQP